jgi:hypothetical protein
MKGDTKFTKIRHLRIVKNMVANGCKVGKAMRDAGLSKNYAHNPQKLLKTKSFKLLLNEYLPEEKVMEVHKEMLNAQRPVVCDKEVEMYSDNDARLKAVDMAIKMRGRYAPEKFEDTTPYAGLSNAELLIKEKELTAKLAKKIKK